MLQQVVYVWLLSVLAAAQDDVSYQVNYFQAKLDHFSFTTESTFKLRYLVNNTYWEPGGPILFYTGNEGDITLFANNTGLMWKMAPVLRASLVFAEHRYYGESLPFGNLSFSSPKYSGYLSSSQALADYVELISYLKENSPRSAVIAIGGSYGGMLAAWLRMKYPATVQGALASSAPIWQFTGMTPCWAFNKVASSAYSSTSQECFLSIRKSWALIDQRAATDEGREWLSSKWKLCKKLKTEDDAKELKAWLNEVYINIAMTNYPYPTEFLAPLPANPVKVICSYLLDSKASSDVLLSNIFQAVSVYFNGTHQVKCLDVNETATDDLGTLGWDYQSCTEMVMPMCDDGKSDMFEKSPWDLDKVSSDCMKRFGVRPQPDLARQLYGGKDIRSSSNIIFSNGLLDPWASGGVLKNISDSVVAVIIPESAHHLDLRFNNPADPWSVRSARKFYLSEFRRWISDYTRLSAA